MIERKHIEAIDSAHNNLLAMLKGEYSVYPDEDHNWLILPDAIFAALAAFDASPWRSMDSAPKDERILAVVDGRARVVSYGKTSHVPMYGWCIADMGPEERDLCEPACWMPMPLTAAPEVER